MCPLKSFRQFLITLTFLMMPAITFGEEINSADGFRKWTEKESGRAIFGKIEGKRNQGSEIRVLLKNSKSVWIKISILSEQDQAFASKWEKKNLVMIAQIMSWSTNREKRYETWTAENNDKAAFLAIAGKDQWSDRSLGITLDNRGTEIDVVVDVFWFGFPLNNKKQRFVNGRATKIHRIPPEDRILISCEGGFVYKDRSLTYLEADLKKAEINGLFANGWSGYTYAGWAVRVSSVDGELIGAQAAQPPFLDLISSVPFPTVSKKKSP